ncbi:hypothetical protein BLA29_015251, partial [Euroglyphus maynei]
MLIISIEQNVPVDDEPSIVEVIDDDDQNENDEIKPETEIDEQIEQDAAKTDLPEVNELEIHKKEIKFTVIDDASSEMKPNEMPSE